MKKEDLRLNGMKDDSDAIIMAIPIDETAHPFFNRRRRFESDLFHEIINIGVGGRNISRLDRDQPPLPFLAETSLQEIKKGEERHRTIISDIENPIGSGAGGGIGTPTVPFRIGGRNLLTDTNDPLDDIVDVSEVAFHPTEVIKLDRLSGEDRPGKKEEGHIGSPPGTIDGEETKSGCRNPIEMRVGVRHQLVRLLRGGIERNRMINPVVHREGHLGVRSIDRTGRSIDEVGNIGMPATFQNMKKSDEVAFNIDVRVCETVADPRLRRKMEHPLKPLALKESVDGAPIGEIGFDKSEGRFSFELREAAFFQLDIIIIVQIIETDHLMTLPQKPLREVKPDKSGRPGNEDFQ